MAQEEELTRLRARVAVLEQELAALQQQPATSEFPAVELDPQVWHLAFDNAPYSIAINRMSDGAYLAVNPAFLRLSGYSAAEILGRPAATLVEQDQAAASQEVVEALWRHGQVRDVETVVRNRDGSLRRVVYSATLFQSKGDPCCISMTMDVTERRQAEAASRESEERFRRLFEGSADATLLYEDGHYTDCNDAAARLLGLASREQIRGRTLGQFSPERQPSGESSERLAQTLVGRATESGARLYEWTFRRENGELFPAEVQLTPIEHGARQLVHMVLRDLTERRKAEAAAQRRQQLQQRQSEAILALTLGGTLFRGDFRQAVRQITEICAGLLETGRVGVWLYEPGFELIRCVDLYDRRRQTHTEGAELRAAEFPSYNQAQRQGKGVTADDVFADARTRDIPRAYFEEHDIRSLMDTPIWLEGKVGGVLSFEQTETPRAWTAEEERLAASMATLLSLCFEVDRRRLAQEALSEQERRLSDVAANLPGIIFQFRVQPDGTQGLAFVSERGFELLGLDPRAEDPYPFFCAHLVPEDRERFFQSVAEALECGAPWRFEGRYVRPSGDLLWLSGWALPQRHGREVRYNGLWLDVTEQKRAEAALRQSEATLQSLFRAAPVGLAIHVGRSPRSVNARLCEILGRDPAELIDRSTRCAYETDEEYERVGRELYGRLWEQGESQVESRFRRPDGSLRDVFLHAAPLDLGDPQQGAVIAVLDITDRKRAEAANLATEARYRSLVDSATDAIVTSDARGHIVGWNRAAEVIFGYTQAEAMLQPVAMLLPEDYRAAHREAMARFLETTQPRIMGGSVESMGVRRDGVTFPIEISLSHWRLWEEVFFCAIIRDVTARKEAEAALRQSEATLRSLYRAVPVGLVTLQDRVFRTVNARFAELTGLAPERLLGSTPRQLYVTEEEYRRVGRMLYEELWTRGSSYVETRFRCADGRLRDVFLYAAPLNPQDRTAGVAVAVQDITEQRRDADRLSQQAALLEATHDALIVWGAAGGVRYLNTAAELLTGRRADEALGQDLAFVLHTRSELELRAALQSASEAGEWSGELTLLTAQGAEVFVDSRWTRIPGPNAGEKVLLVTCNDISEKKRLEAQYLRAQRLESVGTLASGVAHDLNNILSPVIMGVELLKDTITDPEDRGVLAMMEESARRGTDTVRQLLTFARGGDSQRGPVQPRHLLKEVARLLQQTFPKNIQVYTDFTGQPATVLADPSQLHQVLMNLCVNARDAMPDGGVLYLTVESARLERAEAMLHPKARPGDYAVLKVADSGSGIPREIIDRIFDPFFSTKPQGKGTGLGLATVLGIVESHGGFVVVESELGKGTTFSVHLPATPVGEPAAAPAEVLAKARSGRSELILVVDDEPPVAHVAERVLRRRGYEVLVAFNGSEAMELFGQHHARVRLVLTDIMMPAGDGRQLITLLRERAPALDIIAMSGLATQDARREILGRGARLFLPKPFSTEQLLEALSQVLNPESG